MKKRVDNFPWIFLFAAILIIVFSILIQDTQGIDPTTIKTPTFG